MSKDDDEEEEKEECFYESFDRIVSSSNSSTSNSDDDNDADFNSSFPSYHCYQPTTDPYNSSCAAATVSCGSMSTSSVSKFPMCARSYDVWPESFSSSVEQRRDRLLRALGLASDPTLSRRKSATSGNANGFRADCSGSVSLDHLNCGDQKAGIDKRVHNSSVLQSKSEGSTECETEARHGGSVHDQCNSSVSTSSSIFSIHSHTVNRDSHKNYYNNVDSIVGVDNLVGDGSLGSLSCLNKPPSGKTSRRVDEIQCHSRNSSGNLCCDSPRDGNTDSGDTCGMTVDCNGAEKVFDRMCTIKNLDNGKEFVVDEIREDGMWDKLKEVGTGRRLTMEEFQMSVGQSPIVQELMRRQNVKDCNKEGSDLHTDGNGESRSKLKKKVSWLRSIKCVASSVTGHKERRSSDERDTTSEKGGRRSSSATDDSQDVSFHGPERVRVRHYGKSVKELSAVYKSQEIQGHNGSIWSIKFSLDGKYLASAGEDCVIHVWQVVETERKGELLIDRSDDVGLSFVFLTNASPEPTSVSPSLENPLDKKRRGRTSISRKSVSLDHIVMPDTVFGLSEKPFCSFQGHLDDVLDLSWSKSQLLLSSSMDKTVRLWNLSSKSCLKIFSHSDYVTCIQFNPVDDRYFISGSLDAKVRIWSIPERQVVDWNDLHEMVTAACYTPDGQGALVGSYKGSCHLYNISENKLEQKLLIDLQNKKKKSHLKKITGFQFAPGSSSEVLITSADSRVRVVNGIDLVHKFKGFRNANSQISASLTANGKYVVCASEDSHVYVWKHEVESRPSRSKGVTISRSYEHFHCQDVSVATPWPGISDSWGLPDTCGGEQNGACQRLDDVSTANHPPTPVEEFNGNEAYPSAAARFSNSPFRGTIASATNNYFFDKIAATWPEEKLHMATKNPSPRVSLDLSNGVMSNRSAWGLVIVTAGLRGQIRTFQNFGLPVRL